MNHFLAKKKKTSNLVWIIVGVITLSGIGTIAYFSLKKDTKTETKQITEQKVQQLQNQLSQIKKALTTLNQNITQTESSLQTKRAEQVQTPHNNTLPTEINQLEQQLTTYQTQKQKIEAIIPKLELQISSLSQGNNSELGQTKTIQQLEQEIKEINQELGIKEEPEGKKLDNPNPQKNPQSPEEKDNDLPNKDKKDSPSPDLPNKKPNSPNNSQNIPTFQTLQSQAKELITEIDKINKDYEEVLNNWKSLDDQTRNLVGAMFDGKVKDFIDSLTTALSTTKTNQGNLEEWTSDSDYQKFLTLDDATQKTNISLVQDIIKVAAEAVQDSLQNILNYTKTFLKFGEEMIAEFEKNLGSDAGMAAQKAQLALQKSSVVLCESKLTGFKQQGIPEQIQTIHEVYQEMNDKLDWKNQGNK